MPDFINFKDVSFSYNKKPLLKNINITLEKNTFTGIIGPNGSGKTTIGKLITGILKPDSGHVLIEGKEAKTLTLGEIGKKIGYLFQNPNVQLFTLSVEEELSFIMRLKGIKEETIQNDVNRILKLFHLEHLKKAIPFNLSHGEKQRLAIASILINKPGYMVLDEPTTGLDNKRKLILLDTIKELLDKGIGMAVISHEEDFITELADNILLVNNGTVKKHA